MNQQDSLQQLFSNYSLTHEDAEINDLIYQLSNAREQRPVFRIMQKILIATREFVQATIPEGTFARRPGEAGLRQSFSNMEQALVTANATIVELEDIPSDQALLKAAVNYCKKCILVRVDSAIMDEEFTRYWNASSLKREIE